MDHRRQEYHMGYEFVKAQQAEARRDVGLERLLRETRATHAARQRRDGPRLRTTIAYLLHLPSLVHR